MNLVKKVTLPDATYPIEAKSKFYALLETQGSRQEHDQEVSWRFGSWSWNGYTSQDTHVCV